MSVVRYEGKKGVVWRIKYRDAAGRQQQETVGAERDGVTRADARRLERKRMEAVDRGWRRPEQVLFGEYSQLWYDECRARRDWSKRTVTQYASHLRRLQESFGSMRLGEIRPGHVARFIAQHPLGARTVNADVSVLHDVLKSAVAEELIESNPAENSERPKIVQREWRILQPEEVARVLKAFADEQARVMFLTLVLTGVRRDELLDLRWRDVDLLAAVLRVEGSKTKAARRSIALSHALVAALEGHYRATSYRAMDERVFCYPSRGTRLDSGWFAGHFRAALQAAGITEYVRPYHDLRHTALTNEAAAGSSPIALMAKAGHTDMKVTRQYLHLAGTTFPDEAAALEARLFGVREEA